MRSLISIKLKKHRRHKGFTIIEVLIVLAIAGLILLIVFLAIPAFQRMARNTQRKREVGVILAYMSESFANNNGVIPLSCNNGQPGCFLKNLGLSFYNPPTTSPPTKTVSFYHLCGPWPGGGSCSVDTDLDFSPANVATHNDSSSPQSQFSTANIVEVRSWAKCSTTNPGHFDGAGTNDKNFAAEFAIETAGSPGWQLQCIED